MRYLAIVMASFGVLLCSPARGAEFAAFLQELSVYRNGSLLYIDSFDDGLTPPSGGVFGGTSAGTYSVNGEFSAGDEAGGRLKLDTASGVFTVNAAGNPRVGHSMTLLSGTSASNPNALTSADTFEARALYTLLAPGVLSNGDTYAMWFTDATSGQRASDRMDIWVNRSNDVERVRFARQDFVNGQLDVLGSVTIDRSQSPDGIELRVARDSVTNNNVEASFRYWKGGVPLSPDFTSVPFASGSNRALFNGEDFTRVGLHTTSTAVIDEPRSYTRAATIAPSVTLTVAPGSYIQPSGETVVNGVLSAGSADAVAIVLEGGLLAGTGSIVGKVTQTGGILNPGNSPGTLTLSNYELSGGVLEIELASLTSFDTLVVEDTATIAGTLRLISLGGYKPALGDSFDFLLASSVEGGFEAVELVGLDGYRFVIASVPHGLAAQVMAVPEASTYAMMTVGLGLITCALRRRKRFGGNS
jgi:hypothetical protein